MPTSLAYGLEADWQFPHRLGPPAPSCAFQQSINRGSPDAEFAGDRRRAEAKFLEPFNLSNIDAGFSSLIDTPRFRRRAKMIDPSLIDIMLTHRSLMRFNWSDYCCASPKQESI
jgi:hypothetical protein